MKKIFVFIILASVALSVKSQIQPKYNSYNQNLTLINPANSGNKQEFRAMIGQKIQWVGTQGAPQLTYLSVDGKVIPNMGLGLVLNNQRMGVFNMFDVGANYAYKLNITDEHKLSLGLNFNFLQNSVNTASLYEEELQDPALKSENFNQVLFHTGFGFVYNFRNLTVAASSPVIYSTQTDDLFQTNYFYAANNFLIQDTVWAVQPSVLVKYSTFSNVQVDFNVLAQFKKTVWAQVGYNSVNETRFGAGVNVSRFSIAYFFELGLDPISYISRGTHEFCVMYNVGER